MSVGDFNDLITIFVGLGSGLFSMLNNIEIAGIGFGYWLIAFFGLDIFIAVFFRIVNYVPFSVSDVRQGVDRKSGRQRSKELHEARMSAAAVKEDYYRRKASKLK